MLKQTKPAATTLPPYRGILKKGGIGGAKSAYPFHLHNRFSAIPIAAYKMLPIRASTVIPAYIAS